MNKISFNIAKHDGKQHVEHVGKQDFKRDGDNFMYGEFSHLYKSGVYYIECSINNKRYIGSSKDISKRLQKHFSELRFNRHTNHSMQSDFSKFGIDCFSYGLIEETTNLVELEKQYQIEHNRELIYNEVIGDKISDRMRKLISNASKASHKTPEYRDKMIELKTKYSIAKYDKFGIFIESFESAEKIIESYPDYKPNVIRGVCNGSKTSYKGFIWRYIDKDNEIVKNKYDK